MTLGHRPTSTWGPPTTLQATLTSPGRTQQLPFLPPFPLSPPIGRFPPDSQRTLKAGSHHVPHGRLRRPPLATPASWAPGVCPHVTATLLFFPHLPFATRFFLCSLMLPPTEQETQEADGPMPALCDLGTSLARGRRAGAHVDAVLAPKLPGRCASRRARPENSCDGGSALTHAAQHGSHLECGCAARECSSTFQLKLSFRSQHG